MGTMASIAGLTGAQMPGSSSSSGSVGTSPTNLAANFNTFLTLLTTQLKNQDPTNPVDSNQFTQQLVAFAGVQQQVETNTLLKQLISNSQASQVSSASSFIGTIIKAPGNQGALYNGQATFGYTLDGAASVAKVTLTDASGNVVFSGMGSVNKGDNVVIWNGNNSFTGATAQDGIYTIQVAATDAQGNKVNATPYITGSVNSASINNGTVMLNIGALQVPEGDVISITNLPGTQQQTASN